MTLKNQGALPERLMGAAAAVSDRVEFHTYFRGGDVMPMRPVEAIAVAAGGTAGLKPGGLHVMLLGLHAPLRQGETVPLTLSFEKAGSITIQVPVKDAAAKVVGTNGVGTGGHGGQHSGH